MQFALAPSARARHSRAFTLVEILIVLSLMLLLAGIALPTTKELLSNQKASRAAGTIVAYLDQARTEAIVKGQYVGVRFERLTATNVVQYGSTASLRLQRITGVPPYSGEAADASVQIFSINTVTNIATLRFAEGDNLLLSLNSQTNAPITDGDLLELPGGRLFPITFGATVEDPPGSGIRYVTATIDLNSPSDPKVATSTETFPLGHLVPSSGTFSYRIHRKPPISATNPLSFPRGIAIDLNYSGIGLTGNQFAPSPLTAPAVNQPIDVLFGPDGRVEVVSTDNVGNVGPAIGMIYLCLGKTDDVVEPVGSSATIAELFQNDGQFQANITNPDSIWIVINPNTGRVVAAPFAAVSGIPTTAGEGLSTARALANLSDTLETTP